MFWFNLKITLRSLYKNRIHSLLNLTGLVLGFTAFILINLFIHYELSWDSYNASYDRIFRVQTIYSKSIHTKEGNNISPYTRGITAKLLSEHYPGFENFGIMRELGGEYLETGSDHFIFDRNGFAAQPSIFALFTYHFAEGNPSEALKEPNTIVISQTLAQKLFPHEHPIGRIVVIEKKYALKITGVYTDLPLNTTVRPSYLISLSTLNTPKDNAVTSLNGTYMTFALLKPGQDYHKLNHKIRNLFSGYPTIENEKIQLCPLSRLYTSFNNQPDYLIVLHLYGLIGVLILILSLFNYVNLSTAHTTIRAKEIGIRKVHGSPKRLLIFQFLGETIFISALAVYLSFFVCESFLPLYNSIVDRHLTLSYSTHLRFILKMVLITLFTGFVAGVYPSFFMSSLKITDLFKSTIFKAMPRKVSLKKILVTLQFAIAIFLVILSLAFTLQIRYLTTKNLGFDRNRYLYASLYLPHKKSAPELLRSRLLKHNEIEAVTFADHIPFVTHGGEEMSWDGCLPGETILIRPSVVGYDFIKTFTLQIVNGRDFSPDFPGDAGKSCIINETAQKYFGYAHPIGKRIDNNRYTIVGVVKDYFCIDMHNLIDPGVLILAPDTLPSGKWTIACRFLPGKIRQARNIMKQELESYFPDIPFEIKTISSAFENENAYKIYHSINKTLFFFMGLNILLAVMGLLGLVSFSLQRRTKEIGIRKINGSSAQNIFRLLTREYLILLLFSSILAWPFAFLMIHHLPGNYKMPFPYWIFIAAPVLIALVATGTAAYFTIKAALRNPVDALRYE